MSPDHRRSSERQLRTAIAGRDPLALAEAISRTVAVAHAVARRYLPAAEVESLLADAYAQLWTAPPDRGSLERWLRQTTQRLAVERLRAGERAPSTPSAWLLEQDLPQPAASYLDTTERILGDLPEAQRLTVLRAHDLGTPAIEQGDDAPRHLVAALAALAQADLDEDAGVFDPRVGDRILGLLEEDDAAAVDQAAHGDEQREELVRTLRRGRRRLEGLPPTADVAPRLVAVLLTGARPQAVAASPDDTGELMWDGPDEQLAVSHLEAGDPGEEPLTSVLRSDLDSAAAARPTAPAQAPPEEAASPSVDTEPQAEEPQELDEAQDQAEDGDSQERPADAPTADRGVGRKLLRLTIGAVLLALGVGLGLLVGQVIAAALR